MKKRPVSPILRVVLLVMVISLAFTIFNNVSVVHAAEGAAPLLANQDAVATPVPTITQAAQVLPTQYSEGSMLLVVAIILLLGGMFVLLLWWSNKLDQASYLGRLYRDTIEEIEYGRIATVLREKLEKREFHAEVMEDPEWLANNPRPEVPLEIGNYYTDSSHETDPYAFDRLGSLILVDSNLKKGLEDYKSKMGVWYKKVENEATRRYRKELTLGREKAKGRADSAVSVDLSVLRGRGTEFVLEFTTVVVIIFAAVILGILQILDTQQIGTLLAAIAGYVLGRATTRTKDSETVTPAKITELSELVLASKGITKTQQGTDATPKTPDTAAQTKIDELIALLKAQGAKEPPKPPGSETPPGQPAAGAGSGGQDTAPVAPGSSTGANVPGSTGDKPPGQ
jgi:hypothetical protein